MAVRSRRAKHISSKNTRLHSNTETITPSGWKEKGAFIKTVILACVFMLCGFVFLNIGGQNSIVPNKTGSSSSKKLSNVSTSTTSEEKTISPGNNGKKSNKKSKTFKREGSTFQASFHPELIMKNITIEGRKILIRELKHNSENSSVNIYQIDDFLTKEECDGLSTVHVKHVQKLNGLTPLLCFPDVRNFQKYLQEVGMSSDVSQNNFMPGTSCINETFSQRLQEKFKWSYSTAFYAGESKFSLRYEERLQSLSGLLKTHGGKFQVTSYPKTIGYKSHTDCTIGNTDARDRYATALVYLQNVRRGGETKFSKLGINVQPRQGRLIVWNNMDRAGKCDHTSVHEAAPVIEGRKYILQRWYYYKNFPTLGQRPSEPDLPKRKPGQPKVSCDTFEEGSCRWYDEWGYDHLEAYQNVKKTDLL